MVFLKYFYIRTSETSSCSLASFPCLYITVWFLWLRLRQRSIDRAMDLTDSFTWEDLPTRDADTRHLTAAGWIPLIMKYSRNTFIAFSCFHIVQSTIRIVTNHETIIIAWYPFDWTVSPFYELVNISQVTTSINQIRNGFHVLHHAVPVFNKEKCPYFRLHNIYCLDGNYSFTSEYMFRPSRHSEL